LIALGPAWLLAAPCHAVGAAGPQAVVWKINATVVIENMQMNWIWCGVPNLITYHHTLFTNHAMPAFLCGTKSGHGQVLLTTMEPLNFSISSFHIEKQSCTAPPSWHA